MVVASATPPAASGSRYRKHPPYKEMILTAIAALKERGGSSRQSVAKFVADTFPDLPPAHEALLSHHLRRLRGRGLLVMHRHSYKLSPQAASEQKLKAPLMGATAKRRPGRPAAASRQPLSVVVKRRPGRPRKNPIDGAGLRVADVRQKRKPGRPPKVSPADKKPGRPPKGSKGLGLVAKKTSESTVGGEKRKPGRPKRSANGSETPPKKRKVGRPRKVALESHPPPLSVAAGKRKPGRPPKVSSGSSRVPPSYVAVKRKPGRPPKTSSAVAAKRKSSRPPKTSAESPRIPVQTAAAAKKKKRVGRPPKASPGNVVGNPELPLLKRKPGRPPKALANSDAKPVPASMGSPELSLQSTAAKRKPGRPVKMLADSTRKPGRPPKAARLHIETTAPPPAAASSQEKPRRGRPPKGTAPTSTGGGLEVAAKLISRRKSAVLPESSVNTAPQSLGTEMKRRPGRHRKEDVTFPIKLEDEMPWQENANGNAEGARLGDAGC